MCSVSTLRSEGNDTEKEDPLIHAVCATDLSPGLPLYNTQVASFSLRTFGTQVANDFVLSTPLERKQNMRFLILRNRTSCTHTHTYKYCTATGAQQRGRRKWKHRSS
jgi:hypothetical protein